MLVAIDMCRRHVFVLLLVRLPIACIILKPEEMWTTERSHTAVICVVRHY